VDEAYLTPATGFLQQKGQKTGIPAKLPGNKKGERDKISKTVL
jgi:hypothetical protein